MVWLFLFTVGNHTSKEFRTTESEQIRRQQFSINYFSSSLLNTHSCTSKVHSRPVCPGYKLSHTHSSIALCNDCSVLLDYSEVQHSVSALYEIPQLQLQPREISPQHSATWIKEIKVRNLESWTFLRFSECDVEMFRESGLRKCAELNAVFGLKSLANCKRSGTCGRSVSMGSYLMLCSWCWVGRSDNTWTLALRVCAKKQAATAFFPPVQMLSK